MSSCASLILWNEAKYVATYMIIKQTLPETENTKNSLVIA